MLDIPLVIEELNSMLEKHISAICSIEYISLDRTRTQKVWSDISHADLEQAIPLLFQADIDQWTLTDLHTEVYMKQYFPSCATYLIRIKLMRSI